MKIYCTVGTPCFTPNQKTELEKLGEVIYIDRTSIPEDEYIDLINDFIQTSKGLSSNGTNAKTNPIPAETNINGHLIKTIILVVLIRIAKIIPAAAFKNCFKVISPTNLNS